MTMYCIKYTFDRYPVIDVYGIKRKGERPIGTYRKDYNLDRHPLYRWYDDTGITQQEPLGKKPLPCEEYVDCMGMEQHVVQRVKANICP